MDSTLDPVETQLQAYNTRDLEGFLHCFTLNCVVEDGDGQQLMAGTAEMRERYRALFDGSPELHCTIFSRIRIGEHVIDEEQITGRLGTPRGERRRAIAIYKIQGNKICHVRFYRSAQKWG